MHLGKPTRSAGIANNHKSFKGIGVQRLSLNSEERGWRD